MTENVGKIDFLRAQVDLITQDEFATMMGVSTNTLRDWRRKGTGPHYIRVQKGVFYRLKDINEWLELNRVETQRVA